jgi:dihydrofolate reductase
MMSVSVDGYIEAPGGDLSWQLVDDEVHQHFNDVLSQMGGFLSGRRTYTLMADFWPTADQDPDNAGPVAQFAGIWRDMPKTVYSRTLQHADWNTAVVRDVEPEAVRRLASTTPGDLALGGAEVASAFLEHGLVDEARLYVHPVVLGAGTALFAPNGPGATLDLLESRTFGNGVVLLHYAVRRAGVPVS